MSTVTLDSLKAGESGRISAISGTGEIRRRLMEMGLLPGSTVKVVRFAPLGDPIDVEIRGYHLSLRRSEASQVSLTMA